MRKHKNKTNNILKTGCFTFQLLVFEWIDKVTVQGNFLYRLSFIFPHLQTILSLDLILNILYGKILMCDFNGSTTTIENMTF